MKTKKSILINIIYGKNIILVLALFLWKSGIIASQPETKTTQVTEMKTENYRTFIKWHGQKLLAAYEEITSNLGQAESLASNYNLRPNTEKLEGLKQTFIETVELLKNLDRQLVLVESNKISKTDGSWDKSWQVGQKNFQSNFVKFMEMYNTFKSEFERLEGDKGPKVTFNTHSIDKI